MADGQLHRVKINREEEKLFVEVMQKSEKKIKIVIKEDEPQSKIK